MILWLAGAHMLFHRSSAKGSAMTRDQIPFKGTERSHRQQTGHFQCALNDYIRIIYEKSQWVKIWWNHPYKTVAISIEIIVQKYCDIWFYPHQPVLHTAPLFTIYEMSPTCFATIFRQGEKCCFCIWSHPAMKCLWHLKCGFHLKLNIWFLVHNHPEDLKLR